MLTSLAITFLVIAGPSLCLGLALGLSERYARRAKKTTHQYTAVSIAGWLVGTGVSTVAAVKFTDRMEQYGDAGWLGPVFGYFLILAGSLVGAMSGYAWLRMATKRDPDYDDRPSVVPHVGQPRNGDDLGPG